jgi:hypothetical protein
MKPSVLTLALLVATSIASAEDAGPGPTEDLAPRVAHLGDDRRLPEQSIWIHRSGGRAERQYKPWYVHDGLEAVLTDLTGFTMGPQNGHLLPSQRKQSTRKWVAWCVERYPAQADVCRSGQR